LQDKRNFFLLPFGAVVGSGIRDAGSGMDKNQDPGSGINISDPQHCFYYSDILLIEKVNEISSK
jgi:hypothetical protein